MRLTPNIRTSAITMIVSVSDLCCLTETIRAAMSVTLFLSSTHTDARTAMRG